jgi:hypothetical protein
MTVRKRACAASLLALSGLHAVWATGSSWPARDGDALAVATGGRPGAPGHSAAACLGVAGLLATAAALVAGRPRRSPAISLAGSAAVAAVLAARGAFGLAGRTDALSSGATTARFRTLDRSLYSPLCVALAWAALEPIDRSDD